MASVYKRGRWVDEAGRACAKDAPGATWKESRFWTVSYWSGGEVKRCKGYTDKGASEALGARLEMAKARGEQGMIDIYKPHRNRALSAHVADWIKELRQLGRDDGYIRPCQARMDRLMAECGWGTLGAITADSFNTWRETATATVGKGKGSHIEPMSARTRNHYFETVRTFCRWAMKRKRMEKSPMTDVTPVETVGELKRERRALTEDELITFLRVVGERHALAYRIILATGLRRDELRQLSWGDVRLNAPLPFIQLRAVTTKAKRGDTLPIRMDLAGLLTAARGPAGDGERVCAVPSMDSHKRYLVKAGIVYVDDRGRRADFHAMRHTFGTLMSKAGIAPRVAMALMRHTDMRLTMNVYTDPRIFDLSGAVEKLPTLDTGREGERMRATGTNDRTAGGIRECESGTRRLAGKVWEGPIMGRADDAADAGDASNSIGNYRLNPTSAGIGTDPENKRAMGLEPTTFTLARSGACKKGWFFWAFLHWTIPLSYQKSGKKDRTAGIVFLGFTTITLGTCLPHFPQRALHFY